MADAILADDSTSGIYQILNLVNGKRYVGSAIRISKRWAEHRRDLDHAKHHSKALQRAWKKYGEESFSFQVLELCSIDQLIGREQVHIDQKSEYNICRIAGSSLGVKHSEESIDRMKQAQSRIRSRPGWVSPTKGRKYSREICERMAAPKRGRKRGPMSDESKAKLSAAKIGIVRNIGREVTAETRDKIRNTLLGNKKPIELRVVDPRLTLTDEQVRKIRLLRNEGLGYAQIADATGYASRNLARLVCIKARYEWVDPDVEVSRFNRKGWTVTGRKRGIHRTKGA